MRGDRVGVLALTTAAAAAHLALGLQQFARHRLGSYDLVIFDQAVRGYAGFGAPVSPVKGVHNGFGPDFSLLGDHVSPVLALLAPLYWVRDDPRMLLAAQAVLFAAAVPLVWVAARRVVGRAPAYAVALAFGLAWPLQTATEVGFHEVAFAVPLTALALERASAGRWGQATAAAAGLLLVKEDMGLVVAAFGLLALLRGRRALGAGLAVGGILAVVVSVAVVVPAAGGRSDYYWSYDALGDGPVSATAYALTHPLEVVDIATSPDTKVQTLLWLGAVVLFLCLVSPVMLLAAPLLAERLLSSNSHHWGTDYHYNAYLLPILVFAALEVVRRLPGRWRSAWAYGALGVSLAAAVVFPFANLADPDAWRETPRDAAAQGAVAAVPDGVTVEADNYLGPHLTRRTEVLLLDKEPRGADWVVADTRRKVFPFDSVTEQRDRVRLLRDSGYETVFDHGGYVVLHRDRKP